MEVVTDEPEAVAEAVTNVQNVSVNGEAVRVTGSAAQVLTPPPTPTPTVGAQAPLPPRPQALLPPPPPLLKPTTEGKDEAAWSSSFGLSGLAVFGGFLFAAVGIGVATRKSRDRFDYGYAIGYAIGRLASPANPHPRADQGRAPDPVVKGAVPI